MKTKDKDKRINKYQVQQKKATQASGTKFISTWAWAALGIVLLTTLVIYVRAIGFDFLQNWDDQAYIRENEHIKNLNPDSIKLFFTEFYVQNYQPFTMLTYAIDYKIGGGDASLFHFNNILLHLLNTILVFLLIKKIIPQNDRVAIITAAFFAVHPMHIESVAWVAERKDVLYSFFFILALLMYTTYLKSQKIKHLSVAFLFFVLSCLSKSAAVILPLVMLLFDYYLKREFKIKIILEKLPFFAVSLVFGIIAMYSQKGAIQYLAPEMTFMEHISVFSFSFLSYIIKAFVPVNLSAIYPYPAELGGMLPLWYYLSIPCIILLLLFVWYSLRWGKDIVFGFLFFLITIILVLQFIPVGAASMADRYTYIPYIGIFFLTGKLFEYVSYGTHKKINKAKNYFIAALALAFILFSVISFGRVKKWENDEILFSDVKKKYPGAALPYFITGDYYLAYYRAYADDKNKRDAYLKKAYQEYANALKRSVKKTDKIKAYKNMGSAVYNMGIFPHAISIYDSVIALDENNADAYSGRGNAKRELKKYDAALTDLNHALTLDPDNALIYSNRGITKYNMNDFQGAFEDFDQAIKRNSNYAKAYNDRGSARFMLKDYDGALKDYSKAVELNPKYAEAINNRNMVLTLMENSK
ncbi:MAG TPA: tetratricopeptide repeat protein [Bacteroidales bacterium]|mgnify:CR=1 FL=1|nr:tetratricopeptide repeat protein [Bacteroidales bacterium]